MALEKARQMALLKARGWHLETEWMISWKEKGIDPRQMKSGKQDFQRRPIACLLHLKGLESTTRRESEGLGGCTSRGTSKRKLLRLIETEPPRTKRTQYSWTHERYLSAPIRCSRNLSWIFRSVSLWRIDRILLFFGMVTSVDWAGISASNRFRWFFLSAIPLIPTMYTKPKCTLAFRCLCKILRSHERHAKGKEWIESSAAQPLHRYTRKPFQNLATGNPA